jgi:transcriptional regulator with XRE-family HTH domain
MDYGKAIRIARAARGISQKDLASLAGLNGNYISLIESGHRVPSTEAVESLAKALKVPMYLLALLGSAPEDLNGISSEHASILGQQMLALLVGRDEQQKTE